MQNSNKNNMTFINHLELLRWHIIRSLIVIFLFSCISFLCKKFIFHTIILGPSRSDFWTYQILCKIGIILKSPFLCIKQLHFTIQSRYMTGQFTMHLISSFVFGFICSFPYIFWELWRFISPGLGILEKKKIYILIFIVSFFFMSGILFGYYIIVPLCINFLANYQLDPSIINEFDITSYVSTICILVLFCGFMFQFPIIIYFLTKFNIINYYFMQKYRRHSIIIILFLSAIITPPDVVSQLLIAIPFFLLYEFSIFISKLVFQKKK